MISLRLCVALRDPDLRQNESWGRLTKTMELTEEFFPECEGTLFVLGCEEKEQLKSLDGWRWCTSGER